MSTIADTIRSAISAGKTNEEVLAAVKAAHPDSNTSPACVSYYRSKMKKAGTNLPTAPQGAEADAHRKGHDRRSRPRLHCQGRQVLPR